MRPTSSCGSTSTARARAARATGVGFFDHLLDAVARHGGLDLDVRVDGDLETGAAPHGGGHGPGARAGARRGARATAPASAASATPWCRWTRPGRAARSTSRGGRSCAFEGELPGRARGRLRHRPGRGVLPRGGEHGQAHAAPAGGGRHERPPHGGGLVQGVRARAARGRGATTRTRPACRPRRACCEARASRSSTTAWATSAPWRRRSSTWAPSRELTARPRRACARPTAWCCRAWARCRRRWSTCAGCGLDELLRERVGEGVPALGVCMGMQLLFELHHRARRRGGHRAAARGRGASSTRPASRCPRSGGTRWRGGARRRSNEGLPDPCAFYHVHSFAPRPADAEDVLGTADYGSEFVSAVARPPLYGVQFHPEKSGPDGLAAARELRAQLRASGRMILLPAVDIRDGRAVRLRQGRLRRRDRLRRRPARGRALVRGGGGALPARGGPRRRARRASRRASATCERITRELDGAGAVRRRAALARGRARRACGGRRRAWCSARPPTPTPSCSTGALETWAGRVVVAVDVRGGQVSVAGWTKETQTRGEDVIERLQRRGASRFVYTNVDRDGMLEGPDLDEVGAHRAGGPRPLPLLRAASARSRTCGRCASCGS